MKKNLYTKDNSTWTRQEGDDKEHRRKMQWQKMKAKGQKKRVTKRKLEKAGRKAARRG